MKVFLQIHIVLVGELWSTRIRNFIYILTNFIYRPTATYPDSPALVQWRKLTATNTVDSFAQQICDNRYIY